jgi:hypothetical protein
MSADLAEYDGGEVYCERHAAMCLWSEHVKAKGGQGK